MLNREIIKKLALHYQTTEVNIVREYVQHLFLSAFYQEPDSEKVLFKGGTALRIIFQSPRFSGDLDFSGFSADITLIETLVINAIDKIHDFGVDIEISESKKTSGGYIGIFDLMSAGYWTRITMEVSLRKRNGIKGEPILITNDFIPSYTIIMLPQKTLVYEKLMAVVNRAKPRDYFDLYFLLRKGLVSVEQKKILKEIKFRLENETLSLEKELRDFLPTNQRKLIRNFQKFLLMEISHYN
ncbi:MAG: nucleotidyl transferase AbiEii/AbiGii toxin family protein [Candidatus Omnitrophica bacterium]|nr:nucleotidyl transferase AbiEii/AbiGii toxin family protein [Candidatus Omnitrophota bacterium]